MHLTLASVIGFGCTRADEAPQAAPSALALQIAWTSGAEFGRVGSIVVDSRGIIYVADALTREIIAFDSSGAELSRVGGEGSGPGEFSQLTDLAIGRADSIFALDLQSHSVASFVREDGGLRHTHEVALESGGQLGVPYQLFASPAGGFLVAYKYISTQHFGEPGTIILRRLSSSGAVLRDSLLALPAEDVLFSTLYGPSVGPMPYGQRPILRQDDDGLYLYSWTGSPTILRFDSLGAIVGQTTPPLPREAAKVTPEVIDNLLSFYATRPYADMVREARAADRLPTSMPFYRDLLADDQGRIWVGLMDSADVFRATATGGSYIRQDAPISWLVVHGRAPLDATVLVPHNIQLRAVRGAVAYGLARDNLDVEHLVQLQIPGRVNSP